MREETRDGPTLPQTHVLEHRYVDDGEHVPRGDGAAALAAAEALRLPPGPESLQKLRELRVVVVPAAHLREDGVRLDRLQQLGGGYVCVLVGEGRENEEMDVDQNPV